MTARAVLHATWPLFQVSLPGCLPLAILGVAASATPGAEAVASGEGRGIVHSGEWWGLYFASTVLMLICYGGILRQQLARARGESLGVMDSLRQAVIGLPGTAGVVILTLLVVLAGCMAWSFPGSSRCAAVLRLDADRRQAAPLAALRRSSSSQAPLFGRRRRDRHTLAAFWCRAAHRDPHAVVMNRLVRGLTTHTGLSFSRWLRPPCCHAGVYIGAATVSAWQVGFARFPRSGRPAVNATSTRRSVRRSLPWRSCRSALQAGVATRDRSRHPRLSR